MKKRALVIGGGAVRGAYDAGVASELCRELGADYFDNLYGCSAGAYAITFFVANQHEVIENVWRDHIDGRKFIHLSKPLYGCHILDLEYLNGLFQKGRTSLNVESVFQSSSHLTYVLTDWHTGKAVYAKPTQARVFDFMNASSAMPLAHGPVVVDGIAYIDGVLSDPLPFLKAQADECEEIIVVYNKPRGFLMSERYDTCINVLAMFLPSVTGQYVKTLITRYEQIERQLEGETNIKIIRPKAQLPLKSILDSNKERLNACVDMGIADAKEFLTTYRPS